jgi:hypothetical protein
MFLRALRIAGLTLALPLLFTLSRRVSEARGNEPVPGVNWALGVLAVLFLVRAAVTEWSRGPEGNLQKDLLWGAGLGAIATIISRL